MKLIFTLTAGRTGTKYLAELLKANLPDSEAHHEILGYERFGVDTPDISHFHLFNTKGNVPKVQEFWAQKIPRILQCGKTYYAETSHLLMKAGLVENVTQLAKESELHFIILKRDYFQTIVSYHHRGDFGEAGNQWLWYLDPKYSRNLLNSSEYCQIGLHGIRLWYLNEIFCRAYLYKAMYEHQPNVRFHEFDISELNDETGITRLLKGLDETLPAGPITIPAKQNENPPEVKTPLSEEEKSLLQRLIEVGKVDPVKIAQQALEKLKDRRIETEATPKRAPAEKISKNGSAKGVPGSPLVVWSAPLLEWGCDAEDARTTVLGLDQLGVPLRADPVKYRDLAAALPSEEARVLEKLARTPVHPGFIHVQHVEPRFYQRTPEARVNIGRAGCRTDRIPPEWVSRCNAMDEIWVSSEFEREAFAFSGVERAKLHKVPQAIDMDQFDDTVRPFELPAQRGFHFLSVFDWTLRKGWDVLLKAYIEEFGAEEDVCLFIKVSSSEGLSKERISRLTESYVRDILGREPEESPLIYILTPSLAPAEMPRLYRAVDAYVMPSRGESLGRSFMEAMASGLPTIGTRWGGHLEFMNDENAYLIDCALVDVPKEVVAEFPQLQGHRWAEPSVEHLRSLMRDVYRNRHAARYKGRLAQQYIAEHFDRPQVVRQVVRRLETLFGTLKETMAQRRRQSSALRLVGTEA